MPNLLYKYLDKVTEQQRMSENATALDIRTVALHLGAELRTELGCIPDVCTLLSADLSVCSSSQGYKIPDVVFLGLLIREIQIVTVYHWIIEKCCMNTFTI